MPREFYYTSDFGCATSLLSLGFLLDHIQKGGDTGKRMFFYFKTEGLSAELNIWEVAQDYFDGKLLINPVTFGQYHRLLKNKMNESKAIN